MDGYKCRRRRASANALRRDAFDKVAEKYGKAERRP